MFISGLTVYVDKRITLRALKKILEQYVGTTSDYFKVIEEILLKLNASKTKLTILRQCS